MPKGQTPPMVSYRFCAFCVVVSKRSNLEQNTTAEHVRQGTTLPLPTLRRQCTQNMKTSAGLPGLRSAAMGRSTANTVPHGMLEAATERAFSQQ